MNAWYELVTSVHMNQWHHTWLTSWISDMNQWPQYTQCPDVHYIGSRSDPHIAWTLQWPQCWYPEACAEVTLKYEGHIKCFEVYETVWTKSLLPDGWEQKKDAAFLHWFSLVLCVCVCGTETGFKKNLFGDMIFCCYCLGSFLVFFCCFSWGRGGGVATARKNRVHWLRWRQAWSRRPFFLMFGLW